MSFVAALYGVAAGSSRSNFKPGKCDSFGCQFNAVIVLENVTLHPYSRLNGQLAIDLIEWPVTHNGLRIQMEAQCVLKFSTKLDGRTSFHKMYDNLLETARSPGSGSTYLESPILTDIIPPRDPSVDAYEMPVGNNRYRFSLQAPGECLPAPYKTSYGSLVYKLVAYMRSGTRWVQIGEKVLRFTGYHNLSQNIDAFKPVQLERSIKKSIFSSKRIITATLHLESCGYLPNEELPFTLYVTNPKCIPIKMWITLAQRVVYNVDGAKKTTLAVLDSIMNEIIEPGTESVWTGCLKVHKAASPSYSIHPMYTVSHQLQFKLKAEDYSLVKGDVPIFIGTTREPVELLMISANSLNVSDSRFPARRGSASSIHSECSVLTHFTLPPAYSQLSSRNPSFETLPPPYDDDGEFQGIKEKHRNFSGLEFRVVPPDDEASGNNSEADKTPATTPTSVDDD